MLIVCNRLQQLGNLHYVILPHSWLKTILDRIDVLLREAKLQSCRFRRLLQSLGRLIRSLHGFATSGMFKYQSLLEMDTQFLTDIRATSQFKVGPNFGDLGSQESITQAVFIARL